ncbi:hypothetical protein EPN28_04865 [Patescibacteria group bacterium]|nr:MAG: hypothetical protein EPN28_04865 [Patescibacteria group bacterium]
MKKPEKWLVDFEFETHPATGVPVAYLMFSNLEGTAVVEIHTVFSLHQFLSVLEENRPGLDEETSALAVEKIDNNHLPIHTTAPRPAVIKGMRAHELACEIVDRIEGGRETNRLLNLGIFFIRPPQRGMA